MNIRFLLVALVAATSAVAQDTARMDEIAKADLAGGHFMGAVLVARGDQIIFEHAYGSANLEWQVPNTPTTKFRLGSVTKQFTATAIMLLEERGKLNTDDLLAKYLPDCPPEWSAITVRHLLSHTSGIPNFTAFPDYPTWRFTPATTEQSLAHVRGHALLFAPGERYQYSNSNYIVLGWLVEHLAGKSYAEFLTENIFGPLGMKDTGYDVNETVLPGRASGYMATAHGFVNAPYSDMHVPHGAGALYSTVEDLHRWTEGLFGGKILTAASLAKLTTPGKGDYAFGLSVRTVNGRKLIDHGGAIEGFNSHLAYYPESRLTVAVLANVNGSAPTELASQLAAITFGEKVVLPSERHEITVPAAILQAYVGVYQLTPRLTDTIRLVDGHLTTQVGGQAQFPLYAESESKFFLKVVDAQVEFVRDASGKVTQLIHHQGGRSQPAPRISDTVVEHKEVTLPHAALEAYPGTYQLRPGFDLVITLEGDQLMSQATGQGKVPIFAESPTKFFLKVVDAQIEFFRDDAGKVVHLVLHQGGREMMGRKEP